MKWLKVNIALLLFAVLSSWGPLAQADTQFRVIVDASGSMLISDPDRLTSEALRLISNLAPEEKATLGVWLFGEAPRVLLPEAPVNKVTKEKLANYMDRYVTQDVKTDLEAIMQMLLETPDSGDLAEGFDRHWILVTDGMVDISLDEDINKASRDRILSDLTDKLVEKGIHLHTISMTGYTDKELLESLSLRTEATHTDVAVPEDLLVTFDRIFTQASPSDELPLNGNRFTVDEAISEVTLVVFHEKGMKPNIVKPNGRELSLLDKSHALVAASDHYTLITINTPDSGEWQVNNVDLERSSIRVITNLSAQATKVSPVVFVNEYIYSIVGLFQNDILIKENDILDLLTVTQTLVRLNGEQREIVSSHQMAQENSQFKHSIQGITEPGNYELISLVDGKTFSRQLSQYFAIHPAIDFKGSNPSGNLIVFSAKPANLKLNVLRSNVMLEFTHQNGTVTTEEMPLVGQGYWEKVVEASSSDKMKVRAKLNGVTQTGLRFDYWTPYWGVNRESNNKDATQDNEKAFVSILLTPVPSSSRDIMAASAPTVISVGNEEEKKEKSEDITPSTLPITLDEEADSLPEEVHISSNEWIMYVVLNFGGLAAVVGGVLLYRRMKQNQPTEGEDTNDV